MRFEFTAKGAPCLVDLRIENGNVFATISSTDLTKATLYKYQAVYNHMLERPDENELRAIAQNAVNDYVDGVPESQ